VINKTKK